MASVRLIAQKAGVSIATVSRALNDDPAVKRQTRDAVLFVADQCGYVRTKHAEPASATVGFAYTQMRTLAHPFDAAVFHGVIIGAEESQVDVMVVNLVRDKRPSESYAQFFARKGVRGVILRTAEATRHVCQEIADEGFPHVVISEPFESPRVNYIDGDSKAESRRAVEYLISLGHRRIAFAMHNIPDRDHLDRLDAYRQALGAHSLPFDERIVFQHPSTLAGGATILTMLANMRDRPTAVFFGDPVLTIGAFKQAADLGIRIPQDLSVIGFDDTDMRFSVHPTLTAVCQDASLLGIEAARWLTRGDQRQSFRRIIPTYFEINDSVGPGPCPADFDETSRRSGSGAILSPTPSSSILTQEWSVRHEGVPTIPSGR